MNSMNEKSRFERIVQIVLSAAAFFVLLVSSTIGYADVTYYHFDLVGSPIAATDENGNVKWREQYAPFGERLLKEPAASGNSQWYIAKNHDEETGLTYLGARYYDPVVRRFMGFDPVGFTDAVPSSFNRYAYSANNPYVYFDPDGEFLNFVIAGIKGAIENVVVQNIEIQLGLRDEFSFGELVVDTGIATVTSGLSSIKTAAKLGDLANELRKRGNKVDSVANGVPMQAVSNSKKPIVIGENMRDRVIPEAKRRGADYYKPRKTSGDPMRKNERWIDDKAREGREIIDIGPDPRRAKRSPFYEAEKARIKERGYSTTEVDSGG